MDDDGWAASAEAWIAAQGPEGDFARRHVLDEPMLAATEGARRALDVGCGEGRFCRMMAAKGIATIGVDPTATLLARARTLHPGGDYREGRAEALPVEDGGFDLVVSYLTLIDIPDLRAAIPEMARALAPGGRLLIANLQSFQTAEPEGGRARHAPPTIGRYMEERGAFYEWSGIRIRNWHRPLSTYMTLLLGAGLRLERFEEPLPTGGDPERVARYVEAPWFLTMAWRKP